MSASAGRVLIIPKGDYSSATTYNMLDMVYFGGKSYICKQTSTGNDPTNTVYWQIMLDGASEFSELTDVEINNPQEGDGISYNATSQKWQNATPVGITITSPPATVDYEDGDILDLTGIVVMANYSNGTTRNITTACTFSPSNGSILSTSDTAVTVTWRTFTATQAITVVVPIYGVEWDGSASSVFTRTDASASFVDPVPQMSDGNGGWTTGSSPFDDILPWSGIELVDDPIAGKLVKIPKFYYKYTQSSGSLKIQIAPSAVDGFSVSPAHAERGDGQGERDYVYVSAYKVASDFKSKTGYQPLTDTILNLRSGIVNLGSEYIVYDVHMYWTIMMLYLVEFANWDSQGKIGKGCSDSGNVENSGLCDSMTYHTGTNKTSLSTYGHTRYRFIEDLWGNGTEVLDGIKRGTDNYFYITNDPSEYTRLMNNTPSEYKNRIDARAMNNQSTYWPGSYIKEFTPALSPYDYILLPNRGQTDGNSYVHDQSNKSASNNSQAIYVVGAYAGQFDGYGAFYNDRQNISATHCARIVKLPSAS